MNQRRKSSKDEQRKLGARKKIDEQAEFEGKRRKAAEELKQRIAAQVRNFFLKNLFNPQILCRRENGALKLEERLLTENGNWQVGGRRSQTGWWPSRTG